MERPLIRFSSLPQLLYIHFTCSCTPSTLPSHLTLLMIIVTPPLLTIFHCHMTCHTHTHSVPMTPSLHTQLTPHTLIPSLPTQLTQLYTFTCTRSELSPIPIPLPITLPTLTSLTPTTHHHILSFPQKQAQKLSGLQPRAYTNTVNTASKMLNISSTVSLQELAVGFGCLDAKQLASEILKRYIQCTCIHVHVMSVITFSSCYRTGTGLAMDHCNLRQRVNFFMPLHLIFACTSSKGAIGTVCLYGSPQN